MSAVIITIVVILAFSRSSTGGHVLAKCAFAVCVFSHTHRIDIVIVCECYDSYCN